MAVYSGEQEYLEIDGKRVCYLDEGDGSPILFIHGLSGSINNWLPNIEFFKRGYRAVALDLPGCGLSSGGEADYSLDFFSSIIRQLLASLGIPRVTLVGNSLGGLISIHLALHNPELVENLVLVDTAGAHRFPEAVKKVLRLVPARYYRRLMCFLAPRVGRYRVLQRALGIYNVNDHTRILLREAEELPHAYDFDMKLDAMLVTARTALDVSYHDRLVDIACPTLVIWGQKDLGLPLRIGQQINKSIKGSYLVAIPRAAHLPQLDQPDIFNRALALFLAGCGRLDRDVEQAQRRALKV